MSDMRKIRWVVLVGNKEQVREHSLTVSTEHSYTSTGEADSLVTWRHNQSIIQMKTYIGHCGILISGSCDKPKEDTPK